METISTTVSHVPRYIPLTPAHEHKIDTLLERIRRELPDPIPLMALGSWHNPAPADGGSTPTSSDRVFAYMYLVSRSWDVEWAFQMVRTVQAYRREHHLDEISCLPSAFSIRGWDMEAMREFFGMEKRAQPSRTDVVCAGVDAHMCGGAHYWDKCGLPVMYLMLGRIDEKGLLRKLKEMANIGQNVTDVMWEYIQHLASIGELLLIYQQHLCSTGKLQDKGVDASEGLIRSATIVLDAKGLNYGMLWKPAIDLFKSLLGKIFQYYPNIVHRILVVNCPAIVLLAYNLVKGLFDKDFRKKISLFYPNDSLAALEAVIDRKYIPHFLGGDCRCEDNCIQSYCPATNKNLKGGNMEMSSTSICDESGVTEDITLSAGKVYEKSISLKKGDNLVWEFVMRGGKDILFSAYFISSSEFSVINEIQKHFGKDSIVTHFEEKQLVDYLIRKESPMHSTESFISPEDGVLLLVWDNRKSWFSSKKIQMKVYKYFEGARSPSSPSQRFSPYQLHI